MIRVYYNLHKRCWSVMGRRGRVIGHAQTIVLDNCKFSVRERARQKVIATKRKTVHAFVCGENIISTASPPSQTIRVRYNPYEAGYFVKADTGEPIYEAKTVYLTADRKVYAEV